VPVLWIAEEIITRAGFLRRDYMNKTPIEWALNPDGTQGYTWNPITGCLNGCPYCYARKLANTRLMTRYLNNQKVAADNANLPEFEKAINDPFYPRFWEDRLTQVSPDQKPRGIFTCDMSDLFGIGIPEYWTQSVLWHIDNCPQHRFYLLTKQPQNLIKFSPFPDNCWVGVTATNKPMYNRAIEELGKAEATVKYLSFEPLLGNVAWCEQEGLYEDLRETGINWVIIGAQTKPYKPPKIEWVKEILEACDKAGIPVFLKDSLKPLFKPLMRVPNMAWWGNVFGLRQEIPV